MGYNLLPRYTTASEMMSQIFYLTSQFVNITLHDTKIVS